MQDVQSLNGQQYIQNLLNPSSTQTNSGLPQNESLGKDAFLRLMITQLNNQDPLNPQENAEFVAQLAQFSTVEGIDNLNTSFSGFSNSMSSSQALQASSLVGRQVQVQTDRANYDGAASVNGFVELSAATANAQVSVFNAGGELVRTIDLGNLPAGQHGFSWDGQNASGTDMPAGSYLFRTQALIDGQQSELDTFLGVNVDSVTLAKSGDVSLNLAGVGTVPLSQVRTIK